MAVKFKDTININGQYTLPEQDGTVDQVMSTDGAGIISFVDLPDGEAVKIACKNTTASTITKGTPVYITGTVGASFIVQVAPADASNSAKMPAVGLLETDLAANGEGFIVTGGLLKNLTTDPIDGTTPSSNDTIYVKSGGGLTMTKPTGSNLIQNIGKVGRVNSSNAGSIVVSSILRTNDVPNLTEGKIWVGSVNNTEESTVVHIDETNTRIGINQNTPDVTLDITGTDAIQIPKGTDAERPTPESGMFRFNTTAGEFEGYNGTEWAPVGGANTASIDIDNFTGDGTTVNFTLTSEILEEDNTQVYIDGVYQSKSNYTTSGTTLTFSTAPPTGTSIEVVNFTGISESQIDGTGTTNYVAKWTDADTLANSVIQDNGTTVTIGNDTIINGDLTVDTNTLFVDSANNRVGIGQDSPSSLLEIASTNPAVTDVLTAPTRFRLTDKDTTQVLNQVTGTIEWYTSDATNSGVQSYISTISNNSGGGSIVIGTGSPTTLTERMRIDGIGDISFRDTSNNEAFYWDASTARLGIGTGSSPAATLHIKNQTGTAVELLRLESGYNSPSGNKSIVWTDATNVVGRISIDYSAPTSKMRFGSIYNSGYQTSDLMVIDGTGNVGIGTTSPVSLLHINGSGDAIRVTSTNTGAGGAQMDLLHFTTSPADNDIHGVINFGGYYSGTSSAYGSSIRSVWSDVSAKKGDLQFFTRNDADFSERMRIDSSGNVTIGYGTSTPQKLEVYGIDSTAYSSTDDGGQRSNGATISITNNNGTTNSFAQLVFDTAGSNQSIARIVAIRTGTSSNDMAFVVEGGNTKREAMRIRNSGGITFNGDTAAANALDDYEEGIWYPSIGGTATYTLQRGSYTKVGRLVTVNFDMQVSSIGSGSTTTLNLPFASGISYVYGGVTGSIRWWTSLTQSFYFLSCYVESNSSNLNFTGTNSLVASSPTGAQTIFGNGARVAGTLTYMT